MTDQSKNGELPKVLLEAFRTQKVHARGGRTLPLDSNVSREEAERLYAVVAGLRPSASVEVGLAKGVSTLAILKALSDSGGGVHHVIDPFQADWGDSGLEMVERSGLGAHFRFYREFPERVIPALDAVQFAFIDASHLFDLTLMEFILVDKKLAVGGVVGFHDMWMPATQRVVRFILQNRKYQLFEPTGVTTLRQRIGGLLRSVPWSHRIFSQDLLRPVEIASYGNLVLLQKLDEDTRDTRDYAEF